MVDDVNRQKISCALQVKFDRPAIAVLDSIEKKVLQGISEGVRFLREAWLWNAFLKVVGVTGQGHDDALPSCVEEGAFDSPAKPFRQAQVKAALQRAVLFSQFEKTLRS